MLRYVTNDCLQMKELSYRLKSQTSGYIYKLSYNIMSQTAACEEGYCFTLLSHKTLIMNDGTVSLHFIPQRYNTKCYIQRFIKNCGVIKCRNGLSIKYRIGLSVTLWS